MKDEAIKKAMVSIENRIHHVYNQGYEDGRKSVQKAAAKEIFGIEHNGTMDMFSLDEIEEIADYLKTFVDHHKNGD